MNYTDLAAHCVFAFVAAALTYVLLSMDPVLSPWLQAVVVLAAAVMGWCVAYPDDGDLPGGPR